MPSNSFRIGAATVQLSIDSTAALGTMAAVVPTITSVAATQSLLNDIKKPLPTTAALGDMKIKVAQVGRDATNGGYSVGIATGAIDVPINAAGNGARIRILNADLPTNAAKAACFAIFLKIGASDYQLADFAFVDAARDFDHLLVSKPLLTSPYFTAAVLDAATVDDTLGDRTPLGYTYTNLSPTTGGVTVTRDVSAVTVSPDNTADFQIATTRSTSVSFSLLSNDVLDIVRAAAGDYRRYTGSSSVVIEEASMSLATAQARITGNRPFKLIMPLDSAGYQESRLYLGGLTTNQAQLQEAWTRSAPTPIPFVFQSAIQDRLLIDQHVEIVKKFRG